jgi:hypothetical protein
MLLKAKKKNTTIEMQEAIAADQIEYISTELDKINDANKS